MPGSAADGAVASGSVGSRVRQRDDDFADLARRDRVTRARAHDLDEYTLVDNQAVARGRLVRDRAYIGGRIGLVCSDAARAQRIAQARRKRLSGHERLLQAG